VVQNVTTGISEVISERRPPVKPESGRNENYTL
jgi:hypothetical protein